MAAEGLKYLSLLLLLWIMCPVPTSNGESALPLTEAITQPDVQSSNHFPIDDSNTTGLPSLTSQPHNKTQEQVIIYRCPSNLECYKLGGDCITCGFDREYRCVYGKPVQVKCHPKSYVNCTGPQNFTRLLQCRFCYQTHQWEQRCTPSTSCRSVSAPREKYQSNCTVKDEIICLGERYP